MDHKTWLKRMDWSTRLKNYCKIVGGSISKYIYIYLYIYRYIYISLWSYVTSHSFTNKEKKWNVCLCVCDCESRTCVHTSRVVNIPEQQLVITHEANDMNQWAFKTSHLIITTINGHTWIYTPPPHTPHPPVLRIASLWYISEKMIYCRC